VPITPSCPVTRILAIEIIINTQVILIC